ncbi:hypothetical protein Ancab_012508 [Ancistrocladus abbreviatus]
MGLHVAELLHPLLLMQLLLVWLLMVQKWPLDAVELLELMVLAITCWLCFLALRWLDLDLYFVLELFLQAVLATAVVSRAASALICRCYCQGGDMGSRYFFFGVFSSKGLFLLWQSSPYLLFSCAPCCIVRRPCYSCCGCVMASAVLFGFGDGLLKLVGRATLFTLPRFPTESEKSDTCSSSPSNDAEQVLDELGCGEMIVI